MGRGTIPEFSLRLLPLIVLTTVLARLEALLSIYCQEQFRQELSSRDKDGSGVKESIPVSVASARRQ